MTTPFFSAGALGRTDLPPGAYVLVVLDFETCGNRKGGTVYDTIVYEAAFRLYLVDWLAGGGFAELADLTSYCAAKRDDFAPYIQSKMVSQRNDRNVLYDRLATAPPFATYTADTVLPKLQEVCAVACPSSSRRTTGTAAM